MLLLFYQCRFQEYSFAHWHVYVYAYTKVSNRSQYQLALVFLLLYFLTWMLEILMYMFNTLLASYFCQTRSLYIRSLKSLNIFPCVYLGLQCPTQGLHRGKKLQAHFLWLLPMPSSQYKLLTPRTLQQSSISPGIKKVWGFSSQ